MYYYINMIFMLLNHSALEFLSPEYLPLEILQVKSSFCDSFDATEDSSGKFCHWEF